MLLSVLIPTLPERSLLLAELYQSLARQRDRLIQKDHVEIIVLMDQGQRSIGRKRNDLKHIASGEYIVFVDDDDAVSEDYLEVILEGIRLHHPDVLTFHSLVTINGGDPKECVYSSRFTKDDDKPDHYERLPNHLCPVRAVIAPDFADINFGEDALYAITLLPRLTSDAHISEVLYHYRYISSTSRSTMKH